MTAMQAVTALDALTPNTYELSQKLAWLYRVEGGVAEVLEVALTPLEADSELKASDPYDELYIRYMQAQIFLEAGEITRYNNAMALYNSALAALRRAYLRSHVSSRTELTGF